MEFLASLFGYILNFIYGIVNNFGVAIIIFSILVKLLMLPISIKQQRTMKKSAKVQEKLKQIQFKYKNDPEQLNKETIALYKSEKMSPFSGCLSGILQIVLLLAVFFMVQSPLTYMKKVDKDLIEQYKNEIKETQEQSENNNNKNTAYPEIQIIKEKGAEDERVYLNMDFLGLDLSSVPVSNLSDFRVYIIPVLYVISSFISIKISNSMLMNTKKKDEDGGESTEVDAAAQANKTMTYIMPFMAVFISMIAPLGLALYWLVNNLLMILERFVISKFFMPKEEENA